MDKPIRLAEMTREEVAAVAGEATVVLPTCAMEQHGPHLPMATDLLIGQEIAARAVEKAAESIPIVLAPPLPFGNSHHHLVFGAMSLRSETYMAVLKDLAGSLVATGFKRIFFLNSHGGNDAPIKVVAPDLVMAYDVAVGGCSYWDVAAPAVEAAGGFELGRFPGHAGGFETAAVLAVAGHLVREGRRPRQESHPRAAFFSPVPGMVVQKAGEWRKIDGYTEAPLKADADIGRRLVDIIVEEVAKALVAFHRAVG